MLRWLIISYLAFTMGVGGLKLVLRADISCASAPCRRRSVM